MRRSFDLRLLMTFAAAAFCAASSGELRAQTAPSAALAKRGEYLGRAGDCIACHTAPEGKLFAGGRAMATPFGTLYTSNITPDPSTGIGRWTPDQFYEMMHTGRSPTLGLLYPAMPFASYTKVTRADSDAIFAYLRTVAPVAQQNRPNDLRFPYNNRALIIGWRTLFFNEGEYRPNPQQSAEWNRGAYLVEGLAHCGACHTPRNALGAEKASASFSGADVDNWHAYAINAQSRSPVPWTAEALFHYLRYGWDVDHGVARGPMAEVAANLSSVPESDVRAIAFYMASVFGPPTQANHGEASVTRARIKQPSAQSAEPGNPGASIYQAACASCHESDRPLPYSGIDLRLSTALSAPDPRNAANVILAGIRPVGGERSPIMPGFANSMTDEQIAALLNYLRSRFSTQPAWTGIAPFIRDARYAETVSLQKLLGPVSSTGGSMQRGKP